MNQVTLVGRLVSTPELFIAENGNKGSFITLAVGRPFKNQDGEYTTDFIDCILWDSAATNTVEYCDKGDILGIRGRIQTRNIEKNKQKEKLVEVICEKVTFLTTKKPEEIDNKENIQQEADK